MFTVPLSTNVTLLRPTFATNTLQVLKEEEALSFPSLVAECGGVLGLFIGFNFLMIWDLLEQLYSCVRYQSMVVYSRLYTKLQVLYKKNEVTLLRDQ